MANQFQRRFIPAGREREEEAGGEFRTCEARRRLLEHFRRAWNQAAAAGVLLRGSIGPAARGQGTKGIGRTGVEIPAAVRAGPVGYAADEEKGEEDRVFSSDSVDRIMAMELEAVHEWLMTCSATSLVLLLPPLLTSAWYRRVWHWHQRVHLKHRSAQFTIG